MEKSIDRINAYKVWRSVAGKWADWVRVVPFVKDESTFIIEVEDEGDSLCHEFIAKNSSAATAIILDIDGVGAVKAGARLACLGYSVVPLFNGTLPQSGTMAIVDCEAVSHALFRCAQDLSHVTASNECAPVFLLDSNRMHRHKMDTSIFDNSYDMFPQDFPSSVFMRSAGITKIEIYGQNFNKDLKRLFKPYRKKGIDISFTKLIY